MTVIVRLEKPEVEEWLRDRFLDLQINMEHPYTREDIKVETYSHGGIQISVTKP